jgi:hypothetical protein
VGKDDMKYDPRIVNAWFTENGIQLPEYEYKFHPARKWRMDLAWVDKKIFIEVQGGIFVNGRHSRGAAMLKEWEKINSASAMGWRVLYCQPSDLCTMDMINLIRECLK